MNYKCDVDITLFQNNFFSVKAEKSSVIESKEENQDQTSDQDQSDSPELGLLDEEESKSDFGENSEYTPTEGTLDRKEDMSELQEKNLPENTDFPAHDISSTVYSNHQESTAKTESNPEQPTNDSHLQPNRSSTYDQDLSDQGNQEQDPNSPKEEEEGEEQGEVGTHNDSQEREREFPKEHSNGKQEGNSTQSEDTLEESNQPTQVSKMPGEEFEQSHQEQEDGNSNEEMEEETASKISKHNQDTERQSQEGKLGLEVINNPDEMDKKTVSEALLVDPTDDGDDGPRHGASDNYFTPSKAFQEGEKATSNYYHTKYEEQRERARENENVGTSERGEHHGVRSFIMMFV